MPPSEPGRAGLRRSPELSVLTGVRSSKPTFYAEYRHTAESLDRTLRSLDRIAGVLVSTEHGPEALCRKVVEATGDYLRAAWVVLALRPEALPDASTRLVARDPSGRILLDEGSLPDRVGSRLRRALAWPRPVRASGAEVFLPLHVDGAFHGVLGALQDNAAADVRLDGTDLRVLTILANQAVVSLQSEDARRRNEQLLARTEELYEHAEARARTLAERNRELQETRKSLDLAQRQRVVDHERRRLARELHDSVAQQVLSAGMAIEWCRGEVPAGSPVHAELERAKQLARAAVEQLRSSIHALGDGRAVEDEDLPGMLRRLQAFDGTKHFDLTVHVVGPPVPLSATAKRSLFRIASECLFNTAAHAGARRAVVSLVYGSDAVRLAIADDGDGEPEAVRKICRREVPGVGGGYHRGLADIVVRVQELGGTLAVERSRLGGIQIEVGLPRALVLDQGPHTAPGGEDG